MFTTPLPSRTTMPTVFLSFPEELLERILFLVLHASTKASGPNSISHTPPQTRPPRTSPLLVCHAWHRIGTPVLYHTLHLKSAAQSRLAVSISTHSASCVRRLVLGGTWADVATVMGSCVRLQTLDFLIDDHVSSQDPHAEAFSEALKVVQPTHLVVRMKKNVYLTQPKPRMVLEGLSRAIKVWDRLESAHIAFRISSSTILTSLSTSLSISPSLQTLLTPLPSLWASNILTISTNPSLLRIILNPLESDSDSKIHSTSFIQGYSESGFSSCGPVSSIGCSYPAQPIHYNSHLSPPPSHSTSHPHTFAQNEPCSQSAQPILGTGLFLMEARHHPRLRDLIRAGTPIARCRAHTMGNVGSDMTDGECGGGAPPVVIVRDVRRRWSA